MASRGLLKSCAMYALYIGTGVMTTILGPTLVDLRYLFEATYETMSMTAALRGVGFIPGSFLAGFIEKKFPTHKDSVLSGVYGFSVVVLVCSPFVSYLPVFWCCWVLMGFATGAFYVLTSAILKDIWGAKFAHYWNFTILGYSIGGVVTPLLVNPFLVNTLPASPASVHNQLGDTNRTSAYPSSQNYTYSDCTQVNDIMLPNVTTLPACSDVVAGIPDLAVQYGYLVSGAVCLVLGIPWLVVCRCEVDQDEYISIGNDNSAVQEPPINVFRFRRTIFTVLLVLYSFSTFWTFFILLTFIRTFSFDHFDLDKDTASYINTTFMLGLIAAPLICAWLLRLFSMATVFMFYAFFQFLAIGAWVLFARHSLVFHWIVTPVIAIALLPTNTCVPPYYNSQWPGDSWFMSIYVCCKGVSDLSSVWLSGYLYDKLGTDSIYITVEFGSAFCALFALLLLIQNMPCQSCGLPFRDSYSIKPKDDERQRIGNGSRKLYGDSERANVHDTEDTNKRQSDASLDRTH